MSADDKPFDDKPSRDEKGRWLVGHKEPGPGRDPIYDPSMNEQARKLALLGLTDDEIAQYFGVSPSTMDHWKETHPAFLCSLNEGKIAADADVADSLYRRAKGEVIFTEKRVRASNGEYEIVRLMQAVPADVGAASLWLTNRQRKRWQQKTTVEHVSRAEQMSDDELANIASAGRERASEASNDKVKLH